MVSIGLLLCAATCHLLRRHRPFCSGPLLRRENYLQIIAIDSSDFFCIAFVPLVPQAFLPRTVFDHSLALSSLLGEKAPLRSEMTPDIQ